MSSEHDSYLLPLSDSTEELYESIRGEIRNSELTRKQIGTEGIVLSLIYLRTMIDNDLLQRDILAPLLHLLNEMTDLEKIPDVLPVSQLDTIETIDTAVARILQGWVLIHMDGFTDGYAVNIMKYHHRGLSQAETESQIFGPQVAFTESLDINLGLIRQTIMTPNLVTESMQVGLRTQTSISLIYIDGLAFEQNINTFKQRLNSLQIDGVFDTSTIGQLIDDNSYSLFPHLILTERPDRVTASLLEGKIVMMAAGSPYALVGPATFFDFFKATEDHYVRWGMASFIRMLRLVSLAFSTLFTPVYVAALTHHYAVIPSALLVSIVESRSKVPFPPIFEALLLEFIIELLREAGARLPTKVGQTMGIVGGIVIGQAAVQAGFTSNILIMIVALGALSSFTAPSYMMGSAIRIVRFPMIILAGLWGGVGIMAGVCFLILHLLRQTSLDNPYLYPIYPPRISDMKDSMIRLPFSFFAKRTQFTRGADQNRFFSKRYPQHTEIDE
ncbi:spore germination protein [Brevibacillus dissolubilis]|uniref:spore germination protein n=1 Tax=Brevibacillus dissolubilis TaxID=1844116 RepID=UPI00111713F1|nr:spore germination protein [Brevibacillus dissolubilis]